MSNSGKINIIQKDALFPEVRILQFAYARQQDAHFWSNPNRSAPFWRYYRTLTSGAKIAAGTREYPLGPENLMVIPPNVSYASYADRSFDQFYMHFTWNVAQTPREPFVRRLTPHELKLLRPLMEYFERGEDAEENVSLILYALLLRALVFIRTESRGTQEAQDPRILKAVQLMNKNVTSTNSEVARRVGMSCDHFQRLFKKDMRISPRQYLIARRMEVAQAMIQRPENTIDGIAAATGFADRYQFSKTFKSYFGIAPASYRNRGRRLNAPEKK